MKTIFTISKLTFREAARRKVLWATLLLGLLYLIVFGLGFYFVQQEIESDMGTGAISQVALVQIQNFLLMAGLYVVNFLTIAMAVLTSVDTLPGEISSGTMQTLVTKPVRRWEVLFGKWLGFASMMTLYLLLMAGGTMGLVFAITDYAAPNALQGFFLLWMNALLLLSVSFFGGAFLSTLANGALAFGLFGIYLFRALSALMVFLTTRSPIRFTSHFSCDRPPINHAHVAEALNTSSRMF